MSSLSDVEVTSIAYLYASSIVTIISYINGIGFGLNISSQVSTGSISSISSFLKALASTITSFIGSMAAGGYSSSSSASSGSYSGRLSSALNCLNIFLVRYSVFSLVSSITLSPSTNGSALIMLFYWYQFITFIRSLLSSILSIWSCQYVVFAFRTTIRNQRLIVSVSSVPRVALKSAPACAHSSIYHGAVLLRLRLSLPIVFTHIKIRPVSAFATSSTLSAVLANAIFNSSSILMLIRLYNLSRSLSLIRMHFSFSRGLAGPCHSRVVCRGL